MKFGGNNQRAYAYLLIDGEPVYFIFQLDPREHVQDGATISVKLTKGSKVQIRSTESSVLYGFGIWSGHPGIYSWFSGHLLYPA